MSTPAAQHSTRTRPAALDVQDFETFAAHAARDDLTPQEVDTLARFGPGMLMHADGTLVDPRAWALTALGITALTPKQLTWVAMRAAVYAEAVTPEVIDALTAHPSATPNALGTYLETLASYCGGDLTDPSVRRTVFQHPVLLAYRLTSMGLDVLDEALRARDVADAVAALSEDGRGVVDRLLTDWHGSTAELLEAAAAIAGPAAPLP